MKVFFMFLKSTKSKNNFYLQLVESYRDAGKVKHKVLANLGRVERLENNEMLIRLGNRCFELAGLKEKQWHGVEEVDRFHYGHAVYKSLWEKWGIGEMLGKFLKGRKIEFDIECAIYLLTVDRLLLPQSKLKSYENQDRYISIEEMDLNHLYRCLDFLCKNKDMIEEELFGRRKDILNYQVDVMFYDVTTFHFESVDADVLRNFGFSKAGKFNEVQVVFGMVVDMNGFPVGFDIFPGNTYEGDTLKAALEKLKMRFNLREIIVVSDKGMCSEKNFYRTTNAGFDYLISMRLKSMSKEMQKKILSKEGYNDVKNEEEHFKYKIIENYKQKVRDENNQVSEIEVNLLCYWSEQMAARDKAERERLIEKANKALKTGISFNDKKGCKRYLKTAGDKKVVGIDDKKIEEDSRYDGYYVIQSSNKTLSAEEILSGYKSLWKIENSFRVMKSNLRSRPVFHWTPKRITGHFVLCFISLLLERTLEMKLAKNKIHTSPEQIQKALNSLQVSLIKINEKEYYLKGKADKLAGEIMRIMHLKQPQNMTPKEEFKIL
jgi:transposase